MTTAPGRHRRQVASPTAVGWPSSSPHTNQKLNAIETKNINPKKIVIFRVSSGMGCHPGSLDACSATGEFPRQIGTKPANEAALQRSLGIAANRMFVLPMAHARRQGRRTRTAESLRLESHHKHRPLARLGYYPNSSLGLRRACEKGQLPGAILLWPGDVEASRWIAEANFQACHLGIDAASVHERGRSQLAMDTNCHPRNLTLKITLQRLAVLRRLARFCAVLRPPAPVLQESPCPPKLLTILCYRSAAICSEKANPTLFPGRYPEQPLQ